MLVSARDAEQRGAHVLPQLEVAAPYVDVAPAVDERVVEAVAVAHQQRQHVQPLRHAVHREDVDQDHHAIRQPRDDVDQDDEQHG